MTILFYLFCWSFCLQCFFLIFVFSKLAFLKNSKIANPLLVDTPSVSIVICARNEAQNLYKYLPSILAQNYPNFEVIVIDDASEDTTWKILNDFKKIYTQKLKVFRIENKLSSGKKSALTFGIEQTKNDWLLLTDADCSPLSNDWILGMMQGRVYPQTQIVLGYAPYRAENTLLNDFIRFETVWTAIQYLSFALVGAPYMGVGRNVLYQRKLFFEAGGFVQHRDLASGDDDLFINQVATASNTRITIAPETFMISDAKNTLKTYIRQKKRHLSAGVRYRWKHQIMLGLVANSYFLVYILGFLLIALNYSTIFVITFLTIKISLTWWLYGKIVKKLQEKTLFYKILGLELAFLLFYALLVPLLLLSNKKQPIWK